MNTHVAFMEPLRPGDAPHRVAAGTDTHCTIVLARCLLDAARLGYQCPDCHRFEESGHTLTCPNQDVDMEIVTRPEGWKPRTGYIRKLTEDELR